MLRVIYRQAEVVLRLFSDRNTSRDHRQRYQEAANALAQYAYDATVWVDPKWHLIACRYMFPMHMTMYGGLSDCMEMVRCVVVSVRGFR